MTKEEILSIVNYRIELANSTIKEAESHLHNGFLNTAMNRIYYSGFYIVSALAALDNFPTSKHKQLIGYFNKEYVKAGIVDFELSKILKISFERRQAADYHDFVYLTKTQIDEYRLKMNEFILTIEKIIKNKLENII